MFWKKKKVELEDVGSGGGVVLLLRVQEAEKGVQESCGVVKGEGGGSQEGLEAGVSRLPCLMLRTNHSHIV